jgi:coenzyme F420-reducing hydrogenase beta subunit
VNSILDKGNNPCSSCGVCAITCPSHAISMVHNIDGFYRPVVDENKCTNCGLCKRVCYKYIVTPETFNNYFQDKEIYGAWSKDESVVLNSSSGGAGHELILRALKEDYEIAGVVFDTKTDTCKHEIGKNEKDVEKFRSSKYLQSYTVDAFRQFEANKKYMVVGTPCQIYGLRKFIQLKKWEDNFILVDFFCHGTPTYLLWEKYKEFIQREQGIKEFKEVLFRSKENSSWHKNTMKISDSSNNQYLKTNAFKRDLFFKFFLSNTCLNKSCYKCLVRIDNCASDIRLADFWGLKYLYSKQGVSLISLNTSKGKELFNRGLNNMNFEKCSFQDLEKSQPTRFITKNTYDRKIIEYLKSRKSLMDIYKVTIIPPIKDRFLMKIKELKQNLKNKVITR